VSADTNHIKAGMPVLALDAYDEWLPMVSTSAVEGVYNERGERIHDFAVIWVRNLDGGDPIPWPASHVKYDRKRHKGAGR
jgi:hypothetical protein